MFFNCQTFELASVKKEVEKLKDAVSSADIKIKWHQNKLKAEQDTLKVRILPYRSLIRNDD